MGDIRISVQPFRHHACQHSEY